MNVLEFFDTIDEHPHLYGVGVKNHEADNEPHLLIECIQNNGLLTELSCSAIENNEWDVLQDVLMGEREAAVLNQISRVCGYYSQISNWNDSKKGELLDRHKGDYAV